MKIGYRKGFRDGHDEGFEAGHAAAEIGFAQRIVGHRTEGALAVYARVAEILRTVTKPDELAEVLNEIEDVLAQAAPSK